MTVGWQAIGPVAADYAVVMMLKDRNGQVVEQNQRGLGGGGEGTSAWEPGRWVFRTSSAGRATAVRHPATTAWRSACTTRRHGELVPVDGARRQRRDGSARRRSWCAPDAVADALSVPARSACASDAPTWPAEAVVLGVILIVAAFMRLVRLSGTSGDLDEGIRGIQLLLMSAGYRPMQEIYSSQGPLLLDMLYPFYRLFGETLGAARLAVGVYSLFGILGRVRRRPERSAARSAGRRRRCW